ncbi:MAG: hypothetical protein ACLTK0_02665 [Anaerovoracaceae bacterium]
MVSMTRQKPLQRFFDAAAILERRSFIVSDNVLLRSIRPDKYDPNGRFKTNVRNMRRYLDYISTVRISIRPPACGDGLALSVYSRAAGAE